MSRCPECGQKECCGASMHEDVRRIESQLERAVELLKQYRIKAEIYQPDEECAAFLTELDKEK